MSELEFVEDTHTYSYNGVVLPSVTQIISEILPDKYSGINKRVLNEKAKFGTEGHKIIECLDVRDMESTKRHVREIKNKDLEICLREYLRLVKKYNINPIAHEQRVHYSYIYAGTLDMIAGVGFDLSLIDVKFTSTLDYSYLSWQLGMYAIALNNDIHFDKYYCLWLPKGQLGQLVEIQPKGEYEILSELFNLGYIDVGYIRTHKLDIIGSKLKW